MKTTEFSMAYYLLLLVVLAVTSHASVMDGTSFRADAEVLDSILGYHYHGEFIINIDSNNNVYIIWPDEEFLTDDNDDRDRYFQTFIAVGDIAEHVSWETGDIFIVFSNIAFNIPHYSSNPIWLNNNWEQMDNMELEDYIDNALRQTEVTSWYDDYERLQSLVNEMH